MSILSQYHIIFTLCHWKRHFQI